MAATNQPAAAEPTTVLVFPEAMAVGSVFARLPGETWQPVGGAQGSVRVPAGAKVRLQLTEEALLDPQFLSALPSRGIHHLEARRLPLQKPDIEALARLEDLESLSLPYCPVTDEALTPLAGLRNLRSLNLTGTWISGAILELLAGLPALEALELNNTEVSGEALACLQKFPRLESLRMGATLAGNEAMKHILPLAERLREWEPCGLMTNVAYRKIPHFKSLRSLFLHSCRPASESLPLLRELEGLEVLSLPDSLGDGELANLPALPKLRLLWLESPDTDTAAIGAACRSHNLEMLHSRGYCSPEAARLMVPMENLRRLCFPLRDISVQAIAEFAKMPALRELRMHCSGLRDDTWEMMRAFDTLERFHIYSSNLSPLGLCDMRGHLHHMRITHDPVRIAFSGGQSGFRGSLFNGTLYQRYIRGDGDRQWTPANSGSDQLSFPVDVELRYHCNGGELDDLEVLSRGARVHLVEVQLALCEMTPAAGKHLTRFPNLVTILGDELEGAGLLCRAAPEIAALTRLSINASALRDHDAAPLAQCPKLEWLELRDNPLTDETLDALSGLKAIRYLDLTRAKVTPGGAERFRQLRPDVELVVEFRGAGEA